MTTLSTLNVLPPIQLISLNELGYLTTTSVQAATPPAVLTGEDVRVQARVGSGKTVALDLGLLQQIDTSLSQAQALVLCLMREPADQVADELHQLARFLPNTKILTLCGNQPFSMQRDSLQHVPHITVATPGHLLDHLQKGTILLDALNTLVVDKTDRMLDMGFSDAIDDVIHFAPASRQTLLFSTTWPEVIAAISERVQRDPLATEIGSADASPPIEQQSYRTSSKGKIPLLQQLLNLHQPSPYMVFCSTKKDYQTIYDTSNRVGQSALSLHGGLEQRGHDQALVRFANGSVRILVATDTAARSLDIKSPELVVNFELVQDPEVHVYRVGRTARVRNSGLAISFCAPREAQRTSIISDMSQIKLNWQTPLASSSIMPLEAEMATLCIDDGKKAKTRPGDVLGVLTGDIGLDGADIDKIAMHPAHVYIAVCQAVTHKAWKQLQDGKIRRKACRVRLLKQ